MRVGIVTFPGTLDDRDAARASTKAGAIAIPLWHNEADLKMLMLWFYLVDFHMAIICAVVLSLDSLL